MMPRTSAPALFEMHEFEPRPQGFLLPCGLHDRFRESEQHASECWRGRCPSCHESVRGWADATLNHNGADYGMCIALNLRLNHLTHAIRSGEDPEEHDLTVLGLGWTIAPDGSQIPPEGEDRPRGWSIHHSTASGFAAWVAREFRRRRP